MGVKYNPKAIKIMGVEGVPIEVKLIASLGHNFAYMAINEKERKECYINTMCEINKITNRTDDGTGDILKHKQWRRNISRLLDVSDKLRDNNDMAGSDSTVQQIMLNDMREKTKEYLQSNRNVIITIADKGNITLITDKKIFTELRDKHLEENIENGNYEVVNQDNRSIGNWIQAKYKLLIWNIHNTKKQNENDTKDQTLMKMGCMHKEADYTFTPGRLHGQIKVHKAKPAYRPIIDTSTKIGKPLERWILKRLCNLYKSMRKYNILETNEMINIIEREYKKKEDNSNDKILSMDFSSMYTNIPVGKAMNIIELLWNKNTGLNNEMEGRLATSIIEFYTSTNSIFTSEGKWYKQAKGLMMGAALSPMVAAITLDYTLQNITNKLLNSEKYIFMIYADDSLFIGNPTDLGKICQKLDDELPGMPYTIDNEEFSKERNDYHIDYLETSVRRKQEYDSIKKKIVNTITYAWKKKACDSHRTLNYYSDHNMSTKNNTITYSLRKAINLTHRMHINETMHLWENILVLNNYPIEHIMEMAHEMSVRMIESYSDTVDSRERETKHKWYMARHKIKNIMANRLGIGNVGVRDMELEINSEDDDMQWSDSEEVLKKHIKKQDTEGKEENISFAMLPITPRLNEMKNIIKDMAPGIKIAMQPMNKNKNHVFTIIKDKLDGNSQMNKIVKWKCEHCDIRFAAKAWKNTVNNMLEKVSQYKHNCIYKHYWEEHGVEPNIPTKWTTLSTLTENTEERLDNRLAMELAFDMELRAATKSDTNLIHNLIKNRIIGTRMDNDQ